MYIYLLHFRTIDLCGCIFMKHSKDVEHLTTAQKLTRQFISAFIIINLFHLKLIFLSKFVIISIVFLFYFIQLYKHFIRIIVRMHAKKIF